MKVEVEVYGEKIGGNGNLTRLISKRECHVLFTIQDECKQTQLKFILNKAETLQMIKQINQQIEYAEANGFTVV